MRIGGNARADDFDVGGVLEVRGTISGKKVDVGGSFKVQGTAEVEEVDVGGTVDIASIVKFAKLDVGGMARIGGGEVSKDVDVGGKFESTKPLKFSKIDVGGLATLVEGGEGGDVDVEPAAHDGRERRGTVGARGRTMGDARRRAVPAWQDGGTDLTWPLGGDRSALPAGHAVQGKRDHDARAARTGGADGRP